MIFILMKDISMEVINNAKLLEDVVMLIQEELFLLIKKLVFGGQMMKIFQIVIFQFDFGIELFSILKKHILI